MKILGSFENNVLPTLETERLILRTRTLDDAVAIFDYAKRPEVSEPAGFPAVKTLEDEITYLETVYPNNQAMHNMPIGYGITLKGENRVIGSIDFNRCHSEGVYEMGYLLHPDFWGQGIVPEAASAIIELGFTVLDLYKIEIGCFGFNQKSQRVAEKLGFTLEARLRGYKAVDGRRTDDLRYGLLKSEWEEM
ncbi:GNAT family N-acetyltransferase [Streptococcus hongkongensis]|nr:GNAT family acetyltransferase [Streptococcus uberis]